MNATRTLLLVLLGTGALACSGGGDEAPPERETARDSATDHPAHAARDTVTDHAAPAAPDSAMDHTMHGATHDATDPRHEGGEAGASGDHSAHLASTTRTGHAGHAVAGRDHAQPASGSDHDAHRVATDSASTGTHEQGAAHAVHAGAEYAGQAAERPAEHAAHDSVAANPEAHAAHDAHAPAADPSQQAHAGNAMSADTPIVVGRHDMAMVDLGPTGWMAIGMAQAFGAYTMALPFDDDSPLAETGIYLTQPAIMLNVESPQSRVSFRTTLNFEGITQPDGELTFGGWGEGFIDKRHPHTLLHEAMLSVNVWARDEGGFSLSAGKGFAPYGTDDPMSRPVLKYPTNHHLSQILERFTLNGVYSSPRWSVEVGVFGGNEPTGPYDFSNAESFANSFSTRVARRFGDGAMGIWDWELSGSFGYVVEEHDGEQAITRLWNGALRHEREHVIGRVYYMTEASLSDPEHHDGFFSLLGEASLFRGPHNPYGRVEYATRPEYAREGAPGTDDFFRYDHDAEPLGSTRWLIATAGYGFTATTLPLSARPFVEASWHRVAADEGDVDPDALFGRSSFFSLSAGVRMFLGGEPMRMGSYGVLDSITLMHRMMMDDAGAHVGH